MAVAAVVAYHADSRWLPGGFCGVDVFFVISGFLITSIIARDIATERFTLRNFYARRIRRIFPALAVMFVLVLTLGYLLLLSPEYALLGRHSFAGAAMVENVYLLLTTGYFAWGVEKLPLLHLWSLAVEEQFYVVFPLLVLGLTRLKMPMMASFALLATVSFIAAVHVASRNSMAGF